MTASRDEAAQKAEAARTNSPGTCQLWTRTLYGAPSAGDQDHDGDADAVDGWLSEPVGARHVGDRNPPRGVPVAYSGGSHGYGHRAISLGGGKIRSTDAAGSGHIATVDLSWPERTWGLHYLGWSETIDGQPIPGGAPPPPPPAPHPRRHKQFVVDVSPRYQPGFNFQQAADEGIDAFVIKCTEGATVSYGSTFTIMVRAAQATGKPVAVYHWLHSTSPVAEQADNIEANIGDPTLPVMIDCERSSTPKLSHVLGFIAECKARGLRVSMLYLPRWYWSSDMGSPDLSDPALRGVALLNSAYGLNLPLSPRAAYRANVSLGRWSPMGGKGVNLVQFGSRVKVAGMSVDCSVHRGQMSQLHHWFRATTAPPPPPPPPPPVPVTFTVRVATANLGNGDPSQVITGLRALAQVADVIGCQEAGDRGDTISRFLRAGTWSAYFGDKPAAPSVPILYDTAVLEVVDKEAVVAVPQRDVVPKGVKKVGAGPATIKQKIDQHITFRHKATGGEFDVVNTHFIASATRHDMSKGETHGRRKHYADHVTALLALVESLTRPVVVTADWNATPGFGLLAPVVALLTGWTTEATEKRRAIDHVVHSADVTTLGVQTLDGFSDHKYVAAELEVSTG